MAAAHIAHAGPAQTGTACCLLACDRPRRKPAPARAGIRGRRRHHGPRQLVNLDQHEAGGVELGVCRVERLPVRPALEHGVADRVVAPGEAVHHRLAVGPRVAALRCLLRQRATGVVSTRVQPARGPRLNSPSARCSRARGEAVGSLLAPTHWHCCGQDARPGDPGVVAGDVVRLPGSGRPPEQLIPLRHLVRTAHQHVHTCSNIAECQDAGLVPAGAQAEQQARRPRDEGS